MTTVLDRLWIGLGVDEGELQAVNYRGVIYGALLGMSGASTCLVAGILTNIGVMGL